jgi:hypothetical protein
MVQTMVHFQVFFTMVTFDLLLQMCVFTVMIVGGPDGNKDDTSGMPDTAHIP